MTAKDVVRSLGLVDARGEFSAVLPETAFGEAQNRIRFFLDRKGSAWQLLELDAGRERVVRRRH